MLQSKIKQRRIQTRRHLCGRTAKCSKLFFHVRLIGIFENSKFELFMSRLVDLRTMADVIVFKSIRFQVFTLIRYVYVSICIHFQQRFQIDAFSVNTRVSVDGRPKRIEMYAFSNENALVWTEPETSSIVVQKLWF